MRLNKFLSQCGLASRRKADLLIQRGEVQVNGEVVTKLGITVDPAKDEIIVNGKLCQLQNEPVYLAFNKPRGYVCTHANFKGEKSIFSILPKHFSDLKIAGRLDKDSEGLVLLSNDGDFIYKLTHPKYEHEKEYFVVLDRSLSPNDKQKLLNGIRFQEGTAKFDRLTKSDSRAYEVVMHQGWKRQIKRMFENVAHRVIKLKRIREGKLQIGKLATGEFQKVKLNDVL